MSEGIPAGGPYRAALGLHDSLTTEHIRAARSLLSIYCSSSREYCGRYLGIVRESSRLIARARSEELGGDYRGIDSGILESMRRILEFYANYIAGVYVVEGENIVVEVLETFTLDRVAYRRGDIALLPPGQASALYSLGMVRPVEGIASGYH